MGPVTPHRGEQFQPPQYIRDEINGTGTGGYAVGVVFDGVPITFYRSFYRHAGRVTFELKVETCALAPGWYYITKGDNRENLNHKLESGMEFKLID